MEKYCDSPKRKTKCELLKRYPGRFYLYANCICHYLTQREADCTWYLLQNKTYREVAACLKLSPRTVEFYMRTAMMRLNCDSKKEYLNYIKETEFMDLYSL